jgi:hypothetical protein
LLEKRMFIVECFLILASIIAVSEYHLLNANEVVDLSFVSQVMEESTENVEILDSILDYFCVLIECDNKYLEFVLEKVSYCLEQATENIPFNGILKVCAILLKHQNFDEYQRNYSLCKRINENLEHIPEESLPVALVSISHVNEFDFEPSTTFFIEALTNESASIRSAAMFSLSELVDKNPYVVTIALENDVIGRLLETPKQKAFEDIEKFLLIAKIAKHASSDVAIEFVDNGILEIFVDSLESSPYDTIIQGIISLVNSVLSVRGHDAVLDLQIEYEVLDLIEESQQKGTQETRDMAAGLLEQLPRYDDD